MFGTLYLWTCCSVQLMYLRVLVSVHSSSLFKTSLLFLILFCFMNFEVSLLKKILLVFSWGFNHRKHSYCIISSILFCFPIVYGELISSFSGRLTVLSWRIFTWFATLCCELIFSGNAFYFFPLERVQCTLGCKNVALKQLRICFCWVWGDGTFRISTQAV